MDIFWFGRKMIDLELWNFVTRIQWTGIQVVLHESVPDHHIPNVQVRGYGAGNSGEQDEVDVSHPYESRNS